MIDREGSAKGSAAPRRIVRPGNGTRGEVAGFVAYDDAQAEAAQLLGDLHRELEATPPFRPPRGWLGRLSSCLKPPAAPVSCPSARIETYTSTKS